MVMFVLSSPFSITASSFTSVARSSLCATRGRGIRLGAKLRQRQSTVHSCPSMSTSESKDNPLVVMVNGLPGKMAAATADEVVRRGLTLAEEAMTGPDTSGSHTVAQNNNDIEVKLQPPDEHDACLQRMRQCYPRLIVVDYTHPSVANRNVELYAAHGLSFVIGTTGADSNAMHAVVEKTPNIYAVIAPNMGKQIVAFQAMMDMMGTQFPGVFSGYTLTVKESHQANKADTSGTAKAIVSSITDMGVDFSVDRIEKVRESQRSIDEMHVPSEFVSKGHAFHTYHLASSDNTVHFEFQHNVCGRAVYAAGTVDAVQFIDTRRRQANDAKGKRVFTMVDILRSGTMS